MSWTAGPPYDLQVLEVRSDSMVLLWKAPVYQGRDPVNGFYVDMKEAEAPHEAWRGVNNKATEKIFMKVLHRSFSRCLNSKKPHELPRQLCVLW